MARVVDLTGENVTRQRRKERTYGTKTDLASTVVERGSTHWAEGSNVHIDGLLGVAGTATVSGVLSVTGTLNASGQINLSGSTSVTGPLDITGATTIGGSLKVTGPTSLDGVLTINGDTTITGLLAVDGPTTISGTLDIDGVTTLNNDLNVTNFGEINVGTNMTLTPSTDGGSILFQDGSKVTSVGGTVQSKSSGAGSITAGLNSANISAGAGFISVDDLGDWSLVGGANLESIGADVKLTGNLEYTGALTSPGLQTIGTRVRIIAPYPTGNAPNVYMDANGWLYRTSWTP
ncbi:hypothetical protein [Glutamicibacter sp. MCAF14]|uniref:hypothetical protein n=1 Tax=Glutamicibacter sp. MCAF14 TaxID=3233043 RepID=UPI003F9067FA